jgi:uncharacterized protein involved in exopolysaccharide biosynthesis
MTDSSGGAHSEVPSPGLGFDFYLTVVHRYRWLVLAVALGSAAAGFVLARTRPLVFEAQATLVVNRPTATPDSATSRSTAASDAGTGDAQTLFTNQAVAAQVLRETGLDRPPYDLAPAAFVAEHVIIDDVPGSMLVLRVRAGNPDLAVKACNRLAGFAVDFERRVGAEEDLVGENGIKRQLDSSRQKLDELEGRLLDFKSRAQVDLHREDVRGLLEGRRELFDLEVQLAAERGHLAAAESELARRAGGSQVRGVPGPAAGPPSGTERTESGAGDLYQTLDYDAASSRLQLARLESRRRELVDRMGVAKPTLRPLTELYRHELEQARVQAEYDVSAKVYEDLLTRYEQARIEVASRRVAMKVIEPAVSATSVSKPLTSVVTTLGGVAGLGAGVLLAFVLEFFRARRDRIRSAASQ